MASGMPSSRAQIDRTAAASSRSPDTRPVPGGRVVNRRTASASRMSPSAAPSSGTPSDGTRRTTSPVRPSGSHDVASSRVVVVRARSWSTTSATPPRRCSQLSITSSVGCCCSRRVMVSIEASVPSRSPIARGTSDGSRTSASSTKHTTSIPRALAATFNASLVLPHPPVPASVTSRCACRSRTTSSVSAARPISEDDGAGRTERSVRSVRRGGKSSRRPAASSRNSSIVPTSRRTW